jgi:tetratricopeptide (TPR) repeat protein
MRGRGLWAGGLLAAGFLALAAVVVPSPVPGPPPYGAPPLARFALQDTAFVANGLRRLGADLALIQLLQYYGTASNEDPRHPLEPPRWRKAPKPPAGHSADDGHDHDGHLHADAPRGAFPYLNLYALRTGQLDPFFHYAYLFTGGALAFNLERDDQALEVLAAGVRNDPTFWRYRLYIGAIGFRKDQDGLRAIPLLEEAMKYEDCPTLLKNILGNIYKQRRDHRNAARVFLNILETSRDPGYTESSRRKLREMGFPIE